MGARKKIEIKAKLDEYFNSPKLNKNKEDKDDSKINDKKIKIKLKIESNNDSEVKIEDEVKIETKNKSNSKINNESKDAIDFNELKNQKSNNTKLNKNSKRKNIKTENIKGEFDNSSSTNSNYAVNIDTKAIRNKLLKWFEKNHRELPWRRLQTGQKPLTPPEQQVMAYKVWVSEIMLQQTQVKTVIPYFERWMKEFPTLQDLASADLERVNQLWSGLGYYRRAKYLLNGAKYVVETLGGLIPKDVQSLLKIPGIGRYTAGAISSIAFEEPAPVLDGNVLRLISRLYGIYDDISQNSVQNSIFWPKANMLVQSGDSCHGDLNQSLMEMGATICLPKNANCDNCPVSEHCSAKALLDGHEIENIEDNFPFKAKAKKKKDAFSVSCVFYRNLNGTKQLLLQKRGSDGLLANLWQFPTLELDTGHFPPNTIQLLLNHLRDNEPSIVDAIGFSNADWNNVKMTQNDKVKHIFTHINQEIDVWSIHLKNDHIQSNILNSSGVDVESTVKWINEEEFTSEALPTMVRKIYASSNGQENPKRKASKTPEKTTKRQKKLTDY